MKEWLLGTEEVEVEGKEILEEIKKFNQQGRYALLAPNHLAPQAKILRTLGVPDDYAALKKILDEHGVSTTVVVKGDTNIAFGLESGPLATIKKTVYQMHQRYFSQCMHRATDGITININYKEPNHNVATNIGAVRRMLETLKEKNNLILYPYGNWSAPSEQQFDEQSDLDHGNAFVNKEREFDRWRITIKDTFIRMARLAGSPIVPVYVEYSGNKWIVRFGKQIEIDVQESDVDVAKKYLAAMRELKNVHEQR